MWDYFFFFFYRALSNEVIFCDENPAMIRMIAGSQSNPSEVCLSLCSCEQYLLLFIFPTLQCSLWQSHQALIQQTLIFCFLEEFGGSGCRLLMKLNFIAQETLTLPSNYSFVFCLVNHMSQVLLADEMLS